MFEINYSQLIQYEILDKLVTYIHNAAPYQLFFTTNQIIQLPANIQRKRIKSCSDQGQVCLSFILSKRTAPLRNNSLFILGEAKWHIGMSSASGSEGSRFIPWSRLKIYWIINDAGAFRFKVYFHMVNRWLLYISTSVKPIMFLFPWGIFIVVYLDIIRM